MAKSDPRFAAARARFQRLDGLTLASETVEGQWTRGRSSYLAFLVPMEDDAVRERVGRVVERIDGIEGVDPYPESYWHMTVKGAGFEVDEAISPGEVSSREASSIAETTRAVFGDMGAFDVRVGLANGFPEVVFLEVWDAEIVPAMNSRLIEAAPVLARYPIDGDAFLPHVSIARFTSSEGLSQLKAALAELREDAPGPSFRVERVDLVRAHLGEPAPVFETIESYWLRG